MDATSVKMVNRGLFLNISSNAIGALSKESAERILKRKDTNEIHQLMYVPIENYDDLKWLIQSIHQIIMDEKDVHVVLELADLLYFFVVPFYKKELVSRGELSYLMNDMLFILDLWTNQDLIELVDAIQFELKRVERKGL
ncbi:hypothetical protein [Bacillus pumilus]|uniref:hypothetical protein n=1 Tax=Bacillus pumilus TaxID=1408 RepID=UPI000DD0351A|nr:hypothetical protein [Bacillus pumilus]